MRLKIADLLPGTDYVVQVRAERDGLYSEWSENFEFTTDQNLTQPKAPASSTWVVAGDSFVATWSPVTQDVSDAPAVITAYELEFSASGDNRYVVVAPNSTDLTYTLSYADNRALFGTARPSIAMRVRAINNKGVKGLWTGAITATNGVPNQVTGLAVGALPDAIRVSWDASSDADLDHYEVFVSTIAGFTPSTANRIFSGLATSTVYRTTNYTPHYFKVRAVDKFNQSSTDVQSSGVTAQSPFVADTNAPNTPTALAATITNNASGVGARAAVSWTMSSPPSDLAGFYLRYRKVGDTNYTVTSFQKDDRAGIIELQSAFQNYEFQIKAFDWQNNESSWSSTVTATSPSNNAPSNVTGLVSTPARDGIRYDWTAVSDADLKEYEITFSTSATFASGNTTFKTASNTLTVGGLTPSTTYYARIRAVDTQGLTSSSWSSTDTETTLSPGSGVSVSDLSGGTFGAIDMVMGPGSSLIVQGGAIRSNTYGGSTYNASATTGFFFSDGQLHIPDGVISAKALKTGVISGTNLIELSGANAIIQSLGYNGSAGFKLSGDGLSIPDGTLAASKLLIQQGHNMMLPQWADFEFSPEYYTSPSTPAVMGKSIVTGGAKYNNQFLRIRNSAVGINEVYLGATSSDYNIPVEEGKTYILSAWVKTGSVASSVGIRVRWSNGAYSSLVGSTTLSANGAWQRVSGTVTVPAGVTGAIFIGYCSTTTVDAGLDIDGVQVEEKISASTTPSAWRPPGSTRIDGNIIRTGSIHSTDLARDVDGNTIAGQYAWQIDVEGDAVLGNAWVKGNLTVGQNTDTFTSVMQSGNYAPGTDGWQLRSDGTGSLLGLDANSIRGESIVTGSLSAAALSDTTDGDSALDATITLNGTLVATGLLGEEVRFGGHGFEVLGAHETSVVQKSQTAQTVTLHTGSAHGYLAGSEVIVSGDVGTPFGTESARYTIESTPTSTSLTITSSTFVSQTLTLQSATGSVISKDESNTRDRPTYISFPTDGSKPNIISGTTTASQLVVTKGATFRGTSGIEPGAKLTIAAAILAPTTLPTVSADYNNITYTGVPGSTVVAAARGHNGNDFIVSTDGRNRYISEHNSSTGKWVATRRTFGWATDMSSEHKGLVYYNNKYYLATRLWAKLGMSESISVYDTAWNLLGDGFTYTPLTTNETTQDTESWIGFDELNSRLLIAKASPSGNVVINGHDFVSNVVQSAVAHTATMNSTSNFGAMAYVGRGNFDLATDRYFLKAYSSSTSGSSPKINFLAFGNTGTAATNDYFPAVAGNTAAAFYTGTATGKFYSVSPGGVRSEYQGGDSTWAGATTQQRWVGYTWYDAAGTVHETNLGSVAGHVMPKRSLISVTIAPIPYGVSVDSPTKARVWIAQSSVQPSQTDALWKRRGVIDYPLTSIKIDPYLAIPGDVIPSANGFASLTSDPGMIQSTTGNSFWKGDDSAQFYQLVLTSDTEASGATGNKPALRIGNVDGEHARYDGNEVQAMADTTTVGLYQINRSGGTIEIGHGNSRTTLFATETFMPNLETGTGTTVVIGSSGQLRRSSSSERYKKNIEDMNGDVDTILELRPRRYDFVGDWNPETKSHKYDDDPEPDVGFIAEEAVALGLDDWVILNEDGEPDAFDYPKFTVAHHVVLRHLRDRVAELEDTVAKLLQAKS